MFSLDEIYLFIILYYSFIGNVPTIKHDCLSVGRVFINIKFLPEIVYCTSSKLIYLQLPEVFPINGNNKKIK